ncbi:CBS domain-containing protein [Niabella beijingensis]|uniref:CBS domain-containing protein n=1 Tax=Niabella beijingensis TaxID=2872700 RepID=UPI001CBF4E72|nr:CBS domain-containing protein [Niabella beijingensis]MBZ4189768.1 CBS domain-containing protein [Niabella beijingensis]
MLVKDLSFEALPQLKLTDRVYQVLNLMQEHHVMDLAVTNEGKLAGIVNETTLLDVDDELSLAEIPRPLSIFSVKEDEHFLKAFSLASAHHLTVVPVVDKENNFVGAIEAATLATYVADFLQLQEPGALVVLEIDSNQYSFSEITKIVEANDAQITQLNTRAIRDRNALEVTIRINKLEVSDIVASFQRYDYLVKYYFGEELYTNELKENYENLMNYLNI